jgi:hypothetical protein
VAIDFKWVINITKKNSGNSQDIHQIPINFKFVIMFSKPK